MELAKPVVESNPQVLPAPGCENCHITSSEAIIPTD